MQTFSTLGKPGKTGYIGLEPVELGASNHIDSVVFCSDELTAICRVTGQPDQYTLKVRLVAGDRSLESKSLKLYLQEYRNVGIMAEPLADKICEDIYEVAQCTVYVELTQKSRGGISLTVESVRYFNDD